ncbi:hypothetical protein K0B96_06225 [Horticoccus luteus]|uniref:Uncharacterized protein n=1 Tax=Horticoccus luteus TaxID=2862869 RepID=A0A8F9TYJ6_9BACT|nr:hypothetical protein [Horticoccus luteus]QYM80209.1 hypothetical protein K0B96_06225 [Horticoccus luteus]
MARSRSQSIGAPRPVHPYAWLWEPLEREPTFVLRSMFGTKAVYLDGKMMLCFSAGEEPWRGLLACTDRTRHEALVAEFPSLAPHAILPKWLYLPESTDTFERTAAALVNLVRRRDPRLGIIPSPKKSPRSSARRRAGLDGHP